MMVRTSGVSGEEGVDEGGGQMQCRHANAARRLKTEVDERDEVVVHNCSWER